jgi:hypothetical protein
VKYGAVIRDTLEMVDLLHMSLISMQNGHPLLEVLQFANNCRHAVNRLSDFISHPILFAGSFAEYYLHFLREFSVDEDRALENVRYALAGGIPSVIQACENEREKIIETKHVFRTAAADLTRFLREHHRTGAWSASFLVKLNDLPSDTRMAATHPFTLKNVQTLHLIIHKFDQMDQFCRFYEEYFGHFQFRHLHSLLDNFTRVAIMPPSQEEVHDMIDLWTRYERFTLHFPNELDTVKEFFQSSDGEYMVLSTGLTPTSEESRSVYSESSMATSLHKWRVFMCKCKIPPDRLQFVKGETRRVRAWICAKTAQYYRHIQFWFHEKQIADWHGSANC